MITQEQADEIGHQIGEISRDAGAEMIDEAFGRINRDAWMVDSGNLDRVKSWHELDANARKPWVVAAAAVRKADAELREGTE